PNRSRNHNTSWLRNTLQSSSNVHCRAEEVAAFLNYISKMNPYADLWAFALCATRELLLESQCTTDCIDGAPKLRQNTISRRVGDPTPVLSYLALCGLPNVSEGSKRPGFIRLHELGVASDIRRHDGGEAMFWL